MSLEIIGVVHSLERKVLKDIDNKILDAHFRKTGTEITFCSSDGLIEAKYKTSEVVEEPSVMKALIKAKLKELSE